MTWGGGGKASSIGISLWPDQRHREQRLRGSWASAAWIKTHGRGVRRSPWDWSISLLQIIQYGPFKIRIWRVSSF